MRSSKNNALPILIGLFLLANALYALKSSLGINLMPGHQGGAFPLGEGVSHSLGGR